MQYIGLVIIAFFGFWMWDNYPLLVLLAGGALGLFIAIAIFNAREERARIAQMTPEERERYENERLKLAQIVHFGPVNEHLVCPHCQTKGSVHAKQETRVITATGKIGGILKTNTTSQSTVFVTQHHCKNCNTTWDV